MSVSEAAQLLRVTEKQVQHLGRRGEVVYVARGLLDGASVRARQAARQGTHTRAWSACTAWAAVALLSGRDATWLGQAQASRLRSRLRVTDSSGLVASTRNRALVRRFAGHDAAAVRLARDPRTVGRRVLRGVVGHGQHVEGDWYVGAPDLKDLMLAYGLRADPGGNFVLRSVATGDPAHGAVALDLVRELMTDDVLTALDSATSADPRERGAATRALDDALARFRGDA
jgi:hypothetical protein